MKLVFGWTRIRIILCFGVFLLSLLSILQLGIAPSQAQSQPTTDLSPVEVTQGWQYRWGDSPLDNVGVPLWTKEKMSSPGWQSFQFPEQLKTPQGQKILWLRVPLPEKPWKSPSLYLRSVPYILEAYLGTKPIYTEYSLDSSGNADFETYQWPIVPLEAGYGDKTLFFRVYTGHVSSIYVGLFDRITVGSQTDLVRNLIQQEIDSILAIFFTILGLISLLLSLNRQEKKAYISFGALTILIGLYTIARSDFISLFFQESEFWNYVHYTSFYLMPVSACIFFEEMFGAAYKPIIRRLWQVDLAYAAIALPLIATHTVSWNSTILPAQSLLLLSAVVSLIIAIKTSLTGNSDAKLFALGFIILIIFAIHDVLVYIFEPVDWHHKIYPWGTFIFILVLGFILERRFNEARKRLQAYAVELETKNASLQKLDQLKDEFIANTSHELKTPLNGIIGIAESLIDGATGKLSPQTLSNLSLIVSSGKRLNQLVNDLLDFSQLKHKKIELKIKPVGIREVTDVVLMLSRSLVGNKNLKLFNKVDPDIPPVDADENRLQQILYNLIGNAIKFTESGTVEVSAAVVNKELAITVADTGIGIPADKLDRIFESFEQADGSIAREYGGAGLGLAVTKQLVQLHGGKIHVESTVGTGSQFTFTLPLSNSKVESKQPEVVSKVRDSSAIVRGTSPHLIASKSQHEAIAQNLSPDAIALTPDNPWVNRHASVPTEGAFQILIVDDEPVNLQVLVNHLSLQNYAITQALNGIEALKLIRNGLKPDLILLDVMMPKMTGYEFCQTIRQQFPANELPVVLLTAKNQVSDLVEGFGAGANDYLTKPVSKNELLARIKTHIRLAKINAAYGRFVPHEFLQFLERESIVDVQLGDQVQKEMTVLFADIRSFTNLSERMSPKENFNFLNAYLSRVSPVMRNHRGFIDKYIGDAVMALFPQTPDNAVQAAIEMQQQLSLYNSDRQQRGEEPIAVGIGLHTGSLMLGTVGEPQRMEGTVIADAVNLASRMEGLTKIYGVDILISEQTLYRLDHPKDYDYRFLGRVKVKGKSQPVEVFEVFDADPQPVIELKRQTRAEFERGVNLYLEEKFAQAQEVFQQVLHMNEQDRVTKLYIERCHKVRKFGVSELNIVIS